MAPDNSLRSLKAFEAKFESKLQETLNCFKKNLLESFSKSQQNGTLLLLVNIKSNYEVAGRNYQKRDNGYPRMKVEFPRWEDKDLTGWISRLEIFFFRFCRTPETSKVEIASNQLYGDAIQW